MTIGYLNTETVLGFIILEGNFFQIKPLQALGTTLRN
jgi:hypothetical protein